MVKDLEDFPCQYDLGLAGYCLLNSRLLVLVVCRYTCVMIVELLVCDSINRPGLVLTLTLTAAHSSLAAFVRVMAGQLSYTCLYVVEKLVFVVRRCRGVWYRAPINVQPTCTQNNSYVRLSAEHVQR